VQTCILLLLKIVNARPMPRSIAAVTFPPEWLKLAATSAAIGRLAGLTDFALSYPEKLSPKQAAICGSGYCKVG
jgi:hypothetical protein